jgi:hypothetical protein
MFSLRVRGSSRTRLRPGEVPRTFARETDVRAWLWRQVRDRADSTPLRHVLAEFEPAGRLRALTDGQVVERLVRLISARRVDVFEPAALAARARVAPDAPEETVPVVAATEVDDGGLWPSLAVDWEPAGLDLALQTDWEPAGLELSMRIGTKVSVP